MVLAASVAVVNTPAYGRDMKDKAQSRLGREDWVRAGLRAMAAGGATAVSVERIAEDLGVTKGSFYWHFRDRGALLSSLWDTWRSEATDGVIARVEKLGGDARARLKSLFTIVVQSDGRLDLAMRAWASNDAKSRASLQQIDQRRIDYVEGLLIEIGLSSTDASARAHFAYHALIGQYLLQLPTTKADRLAQCLDVIYPMVVQKS